MVTHTKLSKEGLIEQRYVGNQTYGSVSQMVSELQLYITELRREHKKVLVLVDLSRLGSSSADSRQASVRSMRTLDFDAIALFGAKVMMKYIANLVIKASGRGDRIRYFDTREQAVAWLKEH